MSLNQRWQDQLSQATCRVYVNDALIGTAWLFNTSGHLLTAAHVVEAAHFVKNANDGLTKIHVRFEGSDKEMNAVSELWKLDYEAGIDVCVLKIAPSDVRDRRPLSLCFTRQPAALKELSARGYPKSGEGAQTPAKGLAIGAVVGGDILYWLLESQNLGEPGFSGSALFSDERKASVAIISQGSTRLGIGDRDVLALPLHRVEQLLLPYIDGGSGARLVRPPEMRRRAFLRMRLERRWDKLSALWSQLPKGPWRYVGAKVAALLRLLACRAVIVVLDISSVVFLLLSVGLFGLLLFGVAFNEKIVEKTVPVEKIVEKTVPVEKIVEKVDYLQRGDWVSGKSVFAGEIYTGILKDKVNKNNRMWLYSRLKAMEKQQENLKPGQSVLIVFESKPFRHEKAPLTISNRSLSTFAVRREAVQCLGSLETDNYSERKVDAMPAMEPDPNRVIRWTIPKVAVGERILIVLYAEGTNETEFERYDPASVLWEVE